MKRSPLIVIFTTVFIDLVGFGIVIPVLPFYAEGTIFNATPRTVGFLFASYSIMQLIFSPILEDFQTNTVADQFSSHQSSARALAS